MVDWAGELEAVHTDGRVIPVRLRGHDPVDFDLAVQITPPLDQDFCWFRQDGSHYKSGWTIRNVQPTWRTSAEQLDRMDALVKRMSGRHGLAMSPADYDEARAILAGREPADPDIAIAKQICDRSPYDLTGLNEARVTTTNEQIREAVLAGIKYGRAQQ